MSHDAGPIAAVPGGVRIRVHVQPRASKTEIAGRHGDAIKIRLAAAPVDGAANESLVRFLADVLGVARSRITLLSGHQGRAKVFQVEGVTMSGANQQLLTRDSSPMTG